MEILIAMILYNCIIPVIPPEAAISIYLNYYTTIKYVATIKIRVVFTIAFSPVIKSNCFDSVLQVSSLLDTFFLTNLFFYCIKKKLQTPANIRSA